MKPLDRSEAVNLARNVAERDVSAALTPKGQMTLAQAVLAMDAELKRLYALPEGGRFKEAAILLRRVLEDVRRVDLMYKNLDTDIEEFLNGTQPQLNPEGTK